ncbi:hypothetical protein ZEAMMB73_Zm00001d032766 [Zea mays]|uniref:Uncharacterized protein n=1 Tax=Zea mays TaxID=4577 RepID=A0A1D6KTV8_MAIZE|nr:hypothetical protein ZEAMMB73_Zm00001d032766 [Zea mays]ONM06018.1 hypothetical protein ZEAMMB73_Zm00001d032766 [Zea mays]ONM06019.1 hypothetical protein ZEAMMB73_Zm00001d032766 [Zea mays]
MSSRECIGGATRPTSSRPSLAATEDLNPTKAHACGGQEEAQIWNPVRMFLTSQLQQRLLLQF